MHAYFWDLREDGHVSEKAKSLDFDIVPVDIKKHIQASFKLIGSDST